MRERVREREREREEISKNEREKREKEKERKIERERKKGSNQMRLFKSSLFSVLTRQTMPLSFDVKCSLRKMSEY